MIHAAPTKNTCHPNELKEFQKKYYAHQQELITAIAGLNKDAGKVDEEKEVLASTAAAQEEGEKNETAASAAGTAQEETEKNETAAATAQEATEKNEKATK